SAEGSLRSEDGVELACVERLTLSLFQCPTDSLLKVVDVSDEMQRAKVRACDKSGRTSSEAVNHELLIGRRQRMVSKVPRHHSVVIGGRGALLLGGRPKLRFRRLDRI